MIQNGETRKSLASQIDRLDRMLDGLAEGVNDTVVTAVKEAVGQAVRQAVQAAITEVLTNTMLQERLRSAAAPASEPASKNRGVVHGIRRACRWLANLAKGACSGTCAAIRWVGSTTQKIARQSVVAVQDFGRLACRRMQALVRGIWQGAFRLSRRLLAVAIVALGFALVLGIVVFMAGPLLASLFSSFVTQVLFLATLVQRGVRGTADKAGSGNAAA